MRPHRSLLRTPALLTAALFAAACNESQTPTAPVADPALMISAQGVDASSGRREFELRTSPNLKAAGFAGTTSSGIIFHGGTVLTTGFKVQSIYWANGTIYNGGPAAGSTGAGSTDKSVIGDLLNNLGGSAHYNINSTYYDAAGTKVVNALQYTGFWANGTNVPANGASVTDAQMVAMLQSGFTGGKLTYDPNTLYLIFTAGTVNLGGGFGSQYCAYHTHGSVTINGASKNVYYAAMPYAYAYIAGCTAQKPSPNADPAADAEASVLVHEIEETHTDAMGNAWFDRRGYENADKCAWNFGTTKTASNGGVYNVTIGPRNFLIQQNWVNAGSGGCYQTWP
ncbi:MAG: hypothetical protein K2R93_03205 [Gemmatimonadaceae bacterium]|nr:hypothetical protein [Gemmatimonadaceae bacterium]